MQTNCSYVCKMQRHKIGTASCHQVKLRRFWICCDLKLLITVSELLHFCFRNNSHSWRALKMYPLFETLGKPFELKENCDKLLGRMFQYDQFAHFLCQPKDGALTIWNETRNGKESHYKQILTKFIVVLNSKIVNCTLWC